MRAIDKKINPLILPYEIIEDLLELANTKEEIMFILLYYFNNDPVLAWRKANGKKAGGPSVEDNLAAELMEQKYLQLLTSLNQQMTIDLDSVNKELVNRMIMQDRALAIHRNRADAALAATKLFAEVNDIYNPNKIAINNNENNAPAVVAYIPNNNRDEIKDIEIINEDKNETN